jgi:hypothetical protein
MARVKLIDLSLIVKSHIAFYNISNVSNPLIVKVTLELSALSTVYEMFNHCFDHCLIVSFS